MNKESNINKKWWKSRISNFRVLWANTSSRFSKWWKDKLLISLKASYKNIFKIAGISAITYSLIYLIPALLVLLVNKDNPEFTTTITDIFINFLLSFFIILLIFIFLGLIYVVTGTKTDLLRLSYNNIRSKIREIIKKCLIGSVILVLIVCIPQFFVLLYNIDHPDFNSALANLFVFGIISLFSLIVCIFILFCISIVIITIWRKYHPSVTKKKGDSILKDENVPPGGPPTQPIISGSNFGHTRKYIIMSIGGITWLVYVIYYVGRAYLEGFFISLGIPKEYVSFQLHDYIYYGAQIDTIIIVIIFTAVLVKLIMTLSRQSITQNKPFSIPIDIFVLGYLVLYSIFLVCFVFLQIFRPDYVVHVAPTMVILMTCIFLLGFMTLILYFDPNTYAHIMSSKIRRSLFITTIIITLIVSPYMSGKAWGAYKGLIVNRLGFPKVELCTNKILDDDIKWITADNFTYRTDQELLLVMETNDYVFIKTTETTSPVYILKPSDILSIKVLYSEKMDITE